MCNRWGHPQGMSFVWAAFIQQESNVSGLTQLSKASDGVGGRRSHDPACCWTPSATLNGDPNEAWDVVRDMLQ